MMSAGVEAAWMLCCYDMKRVDCQDVNEEVGLSDRDPGHRETNPVWGKRSVPRAVSQSTADLADQMLIRCRTFFSDILMWDDSYLKTFPISIFHEIGIL
jgi:hypothetical protein